MSYGTGEPTPTPWGKIIGITVAGVVVLMLFIGGIFGLYIVKKNVGRSQQRLDANNRVKISEIEIRNQKQRVEIAKQHAEIRVQDAVGVRHAQDEIAKTLTPLYVQYEMVDAMRRIAESGRNNTIAFIPSGAGGVPLVYDTANATKVGNPNKEEE